MSSRSELPTLLVLGLILIGYIGVLQLTLQISSRPWPIYFFPSLYLSGICTIWLVLQKNLKSPVNLRNRFSLFYPFLLATLLVVILIVLLTLRWSGPVAPLSEDTFIVSLLLISWVPIAEELYFRKLLLEHLRKTTGVFTAILLVGVLFGLLHSTQGLFEVMFIFSGVLCAATLLTNNVIWAIILHIGWNTAATVITLPSGTLRESLSLIGCGLMLLSVLVIFISKIHKKKLQQTELIKNEN